METFENILQYIIIIYFSGKSICQSVSSFSSAADATSAEKEKSVKY